MEKNTALVPITKDEELQPMNDNPKRTINDFPFSPTLAGLAVIGLIALVVVFFSLFSREAAANQKNVVNDFPKVSERFSSPSFQQGLAALKSLPAEQRSAYLDKNFPRLHEDLVYYLRERNKLNASDRVESVKFLFGSADSVKAEDGNGNVNYGKFDDQLIARVKIAGKDQTMDVIVQCLNGMFDLPGDLQELASRTPVQEFTIKAGEGLTTYVAMATAVDIAKRFNLPLYRGNSFAEKDRITPEVAASIDTDQTAVKVRVYEGDHFDLVNMSFTPSLNRPRR